jgi:hypothetical protein
MLHVTVILISHSAEQISLPMQDLEKSTGSGDISVLRGVQVVQEVDVDAVVVALCADGRDCLEGFAGLFPGAAGHGVGVID